VKTQIKDTCSSPVSLHEVPLKDSVSVYIYCHYLRHSSSKMYIAGYVPLVVHLGHCIAIDVSEAGKGRQSGWLTA
jgi:hypothetical protein